MSLPFQFLQTQKSNGNHFNKQKKICIKIIRFIPIITFISS